MESKSDFVTPQLNQAADKAHGEVRLDPFSTSVASHIEQLVRSSDEKARQGVGIVLENGPAICEQLDLRSVLNVVLGLLIQTAPAERCFIARLTENKKLEPLLAHGIDLSLPSDEWPVSRTILKRVVTENVAFLTSDAQQMTDFANVPSVTRHNLRSIIAVPFGPKERCFGIVYLDNRQSAGGFDETNLRLVSMLANFIYLGIRNASMHKEVVERHCVIQERLVRRGQLIGNSKALRAAIDKAVRLASSDLPVVIQGESGTGKELFSQLIHENSRRKSKPLFPLNLIELADTVVESELFGHAKGAFTGADRDRPGALELAHEGTLFLDEIAETPANVQAKLLRVLESKKVRRMGGQKDFEADVRLVSATHKDLRQLVLEQTFRHDLYYRLAAETIHIPPLRERAEDVPVLVQHFLEKGKSNKAFSARAIARLQEYHWPGNVRQLGNEVAAMAALCDGNVIHHDFVSQRLDAHQQQPATTAAEPESFPKLGDLVRSVEHYHISQALKLTGGNKELAAKMLGIGKNKLYERLKDLERES